MAATSNKIVRGQISDQTGHTDYTGSIQDAVKRVVEIMKTSSATPWVYVNGNPFFFESKDYSQEEQDKFAAVLDAEDEPNFIVTGALVGGASARRSATRVTSRAATTKATTSTKRVVGRIVKQPISQVLNEKTRAQIAVGISTEKGVETVRVFISDYNGARAKLAKRQDEIVAAIVQGLKPEATLKREAKSSR